MFYNNGFGFNAQAVVQFDVEDFILHESHHGLTEDELRTIYDLCIAEVGAATPKPSVSKSEDLDE